MKMNTKLKYPSFAITANFIRAMCKRNLKILREKSGKKLIINKLKK